METSSMLPFITRQDSSVRRPRFAEIFFLAEKHKQKWQVD
jgi:hypothetical protein